MNSDCWYNKVCVSAGKEICDKHCLKFLEVKFLMDESGIAPARQKSISLVPDNCDYQAFVELKSIKENVEEFVKNGKNLYIASEYTGNGKTSWAIKIMLRYFDRIWVGNGFKVRGLFIHVPTLLLKLKNFDNPISEEFKQNLLDCDLVVWDDIATANMSNYDYSNLLMFIESRLMYEKSNIFTTNIIKHEDLQEKLNAKLADRIWLLSQKIFLIGGNHRVEV